MTEEINNEVETETCIECNSTNITKVPNHGGGLTNQCADCTTWWADVTDDFSDLGDLLASFDDDDDDDDDD